MPTLITVLLIALSVACAACVFFVLYFDVYRYRENHKKLPVGFDNKYDNAFTAIQALKSSVGNSQAKLIDPDDKAAKALAELFKGFTLQQYAYNDDLREKIDDLLERIKSLRQNNKVNKDG